MSSKNVEVSTQHSKDKKFEQFEKQIRKYVTVSEFCVTFVKLSLSQGYWYVSEGLHDSRYKKYLNDFSLRSHSYFCLAYQNIQ